MWWGSAKVPLGINTTLQTQPSETPQRSCLHPLLPQKDPGSDSAEEDVVLDLICPAATMLIATWLAPLCNTAFTDNKQSQSSSTKGRYETCFSLARTASSSSRQDSLSIAVNRMPSLVASLLRSLCFLPPRVEPSSSHNGPSCLRETEKARGLQAWFFSQCVYFIPINNSSEICVVSATNSYFVMLRNQAL